MPVDHYWGYHVLLAPFAMLRNAELGMKCATAFLFAWVCVTTYWFLRARGVARAWAWAITPMLFSTQDWRFLQLRGGQVALPLLFALIQSLFESRPARRYVAMVAISYLGMLCYQGAIVFLPFHAAGAVAVVVARKDFRRLLEPGLTALGLALGLTANPCMDARASTWRFAALHIGRMGRDVAHLYEDQDIAEFHGFPGWALVAHPEWLCLLASVIVGACVAVRRFMVARNDASAEAVVLATLALAGAVLTSQVIRTREYSVPIAICFLASLAPRRRPDRLDNVLVTGLLALTLVVHGRATLPLIRTHLPTHQYSGTRELLAANGDHPILNIAEADYCLLRWEYERVVCVQALSRYFIFHDPVLFQDVWQLHDRPDDEPRTRAALRRFWNRGVRLVAVHRTHKMMRFAESHPSQLIPVFRSPVNGAAIFAIDPAGL
jgi:hypothetical protein